MSNKQTVIALHLAEVISIAMKDGPYGSSGIYPETRSLQPRLEPIHDSVKHARLITAAAILGVIVMASLL